MNPVMTAMAAHTHTQSHFFSPFSQRALPHPPGLVCPSSSDIKKIRRHGPVVPKKPAFTACSRLIFTTYMLVIFRYQGCFKHVYGVNTFWRCNHPHAGEILLCIQRKTLRRIGRNSNFEATNTDANWLPQTNYFLFAVAQQLATSNAFWRLAFVEQLLGLKFFPVKPISIKFRSNFGKNFSIRHG